MRKLTKKFFQKKQGSVGGKKAWAHKTQAEKQAQVSNASRGYWDALSPEERSAEMKRGAAKRKKKKRSPAATQAR